MKPAGFDGRATPSIGVILPTYNEATTICAVVGEICGVLGRLGETYEVLVVDDASPDGTADVVERTFARVSEVTVLRRTAPRGLAVSIWDGIEGTRAQVVIVMDADFNHDPADLPRLLAALDGADLVSGSRFTPGGGMYSRTRYVGSYAMNLLIRITLRTGMSDNLGGFFAVRRGFFDSIPSADVFQGYGDFYFRLLTHARRNGSRLREIPVVYRPREGGQSKTPLLRMAVRYTWRLLRFAIAR